MLALPTWGKRLFLEVQPFEIKDFDLVHPVICPISNLSISVLYCVLNAKFQEFLSFKLKPYCGGIKKVQMPTMIKLMLECGFYANMQPAELLTEESC